LMQDRKPQLDENLLQRTAGPYMGSFTSALACSRHVGLLGNLGSGPLAECL
jgi:hypothetical protein